MNKDSKIYIAGHQGMVGSAIWRNLEIRGFNNLIGRTLAELDLTNQIAVKDFFEIEKPEYVFLAAAKVGGIVANNTYRAEFIYENLQIQNNIVHQAYLNGVKKLIFLGSSCIYPKDAPQPLKEEYLLTGLLEQTNEPYAIAKIAGIKMCEAYRDQYGCNFISVMPTNLYGPNDNYDLEKSHVLPALIRKFHLAHCLETNNWEAIISDLNERPIEGISGESKQEDILTILKKYGISSTQYDCVTESPNHSLTASPLPRITLWGSGEVYREFLHVNDMADACIYLMENYNEKQIVNIGTGIDLTIKELAETIKEVVGYKGEIHWDTTKPDGTYKKQLDVSHLESQGWKHSISLKEGIEGVYRMYVK